VVLAVSTFLRPVPQTKSEGHGHVAARAKVREAESEFESATEMPEARSHRHRGNKTPTLVTAARRDKFMCSMTIRRSGLGRRETSGPPVMPCGA